MDVKYCLILAILSSLILSTCAASPVYLTWSPLNETSTSSYQTLVNTFTTSRHYGSEGYKQAQTFILERFRDLNLTFESQTFETFNSSVTGVNLIGILHGGSTTKYYLVGAHYDTTKDNPGVTENGSGMSAVLEIARLLSLMSNYNCTMDYSVIFVGFDMSRPEPDYGEEPPCPLSAGIGPCGVFSFTDWLEQFLSEKNNAQLLGTYIIDSVLNYNTSEDSQTLSTDTHVLLPDYYEAVKTSGYKGNFIAGVVRADDITLARAFQQSWETTPLDQLFRFQQVTLSGVAKPSPNVHISLPTFFQSEHMQLWARNYSAMLLTDTLQERGYQQQCFDRACDSTQWVSVDSIEFGYQIARAVADSIFRLGNGYCLKAAGASSLIPSLYTFVSVHFVAFVLLLL